MREIIRFFVLFCFVLLCFVLFFLFIRLSFFISLFLNHQTFSVDDADNNEKQLYDARTTLLTFQENLHEHFERLFGLLVSFLIFSSPSPRLPSHPPFQSFLPLPWDENTLSEVFHYKWMVVSFSTTADLDHLGALASAYQESCKSLYKAERERSKRRGILSKGLLGRFGLFFLILLPFPFPFPFLSSCFDLDTRKGT